MLQVAVALRLFTAVIVPVTIKQHRAIGMPLRFDADLCHQPANCYPDVYQTIQRSTRQLASARFRAGLPTQRAAEFTSVILCSLQQLNQRNKSL